MSTIRISRPKKNWSVSPRTVLPTALLFRLFKPHSNFTVVLDSHRVGELGDEQIRDFEVEPGVHRLHLRFVGLRKSEELRVSLKVGELRQYVCGTSGMGWPTLREALPEEVAEMQGTVGEPPGPANPVPPG